MSPEDVLVLVRTHGIRLEARGDRLHVEAPVGSVSPALRDSLAIHKPVLLQLLVPTTQFVTLKDGPTLPLPALQLAWNLEDRGFCFCLDTYQQVIVEPRDRLTDKDRAAIARWRHHLGAIIGHRCEVIA